MRGTIFLGDIEFRIAPCYGVLRHALSIHRRDSRAPQVKGEMKNLTRRDFIKFCGASVIGLSLAACSVAPTPTATPAPTNTPLPTNTALPTATSTVKPSPTNTAVPTATHSLEAQARAMMDQYAQATLKMDAQTIAAFYLPDGGAYDNGRLQAQGPDAIFNFLNSFTGVVQVDQYQTTITSAQVNGNHVTLTGTYQQSYTMLANKQTGSASGQFTVEWVRQADGKWLIQKMQTQE